MAPPCRSCATAPGSCSASPKPDSLGGAGCCDFEEPPAELGRVLAEVVETRQRGETLEAEDALEERRRPVPNRTTRTAFTTGLGDQPSLDQTGNGGVGSDAADPGDVRAGARPQVRDDRQRLERRLREPPFDGTLEETRTRVRGVAARPEGVPACDLLEHDAAPPLAVALAKKTERGLDALRVILGRLAQLVERERRRCDDEQRLDRPREPIDGICGDQAERAVHSEILSASALETLMGANGAAWLSPISPDLRSSSNASNATACSMRDNLSTSVSKSKTRRRESSARNRSRNCETGGNRSAIWPSDTVGGGTASARSAAPRTSRSCAARRRSARGASGAGPSRKKRSRSEPRRSSSQPAASFMRRYSASRRASSSAASSGSSSPSSAASSGKSARAFSSSSAETRTRNSPHASRSSSSRSASSSTNEITMAAMSISRGSSSSFRSSVSRRSNGPSKASSSSSRSRTGVCTRG